MAGEWTMQLENWNVLFIHNSTKKPKYSIYVTIFSFVKLQREKEMEKSQVASQSSQLQKSRSLKKENKKTTNEHTNIFT